MITVGVLVSGGGSNLQAILDAISARRLDARVAVVISDVLGARGLERAANAGIPAFAIEPGGFPDRRAFDAEVVRVLAANEVQWVVLAGFMRIVTETLLDAFPMRIVNVHPSLLPSFPGMHAVAQALGHGVSVAGCTVHLVDAGTDTGPVIAQAAVAVREDDDEEALGARIREQEHALLPSVIQWISEGRLEVSSPPAGGRVRARIRGKETARLP